MTTPKDPLELRAAGAAEFDGYWAMLQRAFAGDLGGEHVEIDRRVFEPERSLVFVDGRQIVGGAAAYTRDLTVPGGDVAAAHVTLVGVHPMYRRRGLLTRLMHRQLRDVREAGREPIAVLWASEAKIYQRFGYGAAALKLYLEPDRSEVRLLPPVAAGGGRLRELEVADARKDLVEVYERVRSERVGWSSRDEPWWDKVLSDPKDEREGATARRALLYEGAGGVEGYALWRTRPDWRHTGPRGTVDVRELVATTPAAYTEMWRFLLSVDLTRTLRYWSAAVDEPLIHLVDEPRALKAMLGDSLWLRVVDVPAALVARRYPTPLDVVLEIDDALLPENAGRWRLRSSGAGTPAACAAAEDGEPADLSCDVAALGAAYLGGTSFAALAAAGRVREHRPGALAEVSAAFGWTRPPSAIEVF